MKNILAVAFQTSLFALVTSTHVKFYHGHRDETCLKNITNSVQDPTVINPHSRCLTLNHPYCLGMKLPYRTAALPDNLPDLNITSEEEVQAYLSGWQNVQNTIPECWPYLKVALCSNLMPQCHDDVSNGRPIKVSKPNIEICNDLVVKSRCKFIERHYGWPSLFNCSDNRLYMRNCSNDLRFQDTKLGGCQYPLVQSSSNDNSFKEIRGCSLTCKYPILDTETQSNITLSIGILALLGLISILLAILFFQINKKLSKPSNMAKVIRRCVLFQLPIYIGWLLQYIFNSNIACPMGVRLEGLPLVANACVLSFLLTYLPELSICFLIAYLGRLCHDKIAGKNGNTNNKPGFTLNLLSLVIPATFFVSVAFSSQIDGHGIYGICTVGHQSPFIKVVFIWVPKMVSTAYGDFFFIITIIKLTRIKTMKPGIMRHLIRMLLLTIFSTTEILSSIGISIYEANNRIDWMNAIDKYIACNLNLRVVYDADQESHDISHQDCMLQAKPSSFIFYLEFVSILAKGVVMASWAFCESNYRGLRRKIIDELEDERDRKRRVKAYFDLVDSAVFGTRNDMTINVPDDSLHDLIDITSLKSDHLSRTFNATTRPQEGMEIINEPVRRQIRGSTPSSLGSVSLNSNLNILINTYNQRSRRHSKHKGPTSRDIINDERSKHKFENYHRLMQPPTLQGFNSTNNSILENTIIQYGNFLRDLANQRVEFDTQSLEDSPFTHGMCDSKR